MIASEVSKDELRRQVKGSKENFGTLIVSMKMRDMKEGN